MPPQLPRSRLRRRSRSPCRPCSGLPDKSWGEGADPERRRIPKRLADRRRATGRLGRGTGPLLLPARVPAGAGGDEHASAEGRRQHHSTARKDVGVLTHGISHERRPGEPAVTAPQRQAQGHRAQAARFVHGRQPARPPARLEQHKPPARASAHGVECRPAGPAPDHFPGYRVDEHDAPALKGCNERAVGQPRYGLRSNPGLHVELGGPAGEIHDPHSDSGLGSRGRDAKRHARAVRRGAPRVVVLAEKDRRRGWPQRQRVEAANPSPAAVGVRKDPHKRRWASHGPELWRGGGRIREQRAQTQSANNGDKAPASHRSAGTGMPETHHTSVVGQRHHPDPRGTETGTETWSRMTRAFRTLARKVALHRPHPPPNPRCRCARDDPLAQRRPRRAHAPRRLRHLDRAGLPRPGRDPRTPSDGSPATRFARDLVLTTHWLAETKAEPGSYLFSALYQQTPRPAERAALQAAATSTTGAPTQTTPSTCSNATTGHFTQSANAWCVHFQTVDVAASEKDTADYTVISTWAATPDRDLLLIDCQRQRFEAARRRRHDQSAPTANSSHRPHSSESKNSATGSASSKNSTAKDSQSTA